MKKITLYLISFILPLVSLSQEKWMLTLDEVTVSGNRTFMQSDYREGRYGFGAGIYHAFLKEHRLNILLGLEYNRTGQFFDYIYNGRFSHHEDVTYHFNNLAVPLGLRVSLGRKTKFFIEGGGYADIPLYTKAQGRYYYSYPVFNEDTVYMVSGQGEFNEKSESASSVGIYFGGGVIIPSSKVSWIIKSDYKYGLTAILNDGYLSSDSRYLRLMVGVRFGRE
jgi:hypothetical protein